VTDSDIDARVARLEAQVAKLRREIQVLRTLVQRVDRFDLRRVREHMDDLEHRR
jgi:hypothetical protein